MTTDIPFSTRDFRDALSLFPTGVAIVTARCPQGHRIGVTVNSFTSVSLTPPLVSFNIAATLASHDTLSQARHFIIHLLEQDQDDLSGNFARALTDKWANVSHDTSHHGIPVLPGVLARFECDHFATHSAGDHTIVLGRVTHIDTCPEATPLVFFRGRYNRIHANAQPAETPRAS